MLKRLLLLSLLWPPLVSPAGPRPLATPARVIRTQRVLSTSATSKANTPPTIQQFQETSYFLKDIAIGRCPHGMGGR